MKTKIKYLLVLVLASFVFAGCCTMHKSAQWEYKIVKLKFPDVQNAETFSQTFTNQIAAESFGRERREKIDQDYAMQLNEFGKDGWRLLSFDRSDDICVLERPKH